MEKQTCGHQILRRTAKMPTAAAGAASAPNTEEIVAAASSPAGSSVALESSPSRPSSPAAMVTPSSAAAAAAASMPVSTAAHLKYHYTRDELLSLKNSPLSKLKPEFLTPVHELFDICLEVDSTTSVSSRNTFEEQTSLRSGITSRKHSSLGEQRSSVSQLNNDCDANAHIALVPQRSSFGTGCHVATARTVNSPEAKRERNRRDGHRIGSGRIQISEKYADRELNDHRERDRNDGWYDRCGNSTKVMKRDYDEANHRRRSEAYREGRYVGDVTRSAPEPEWFTEGPLSQSDTIELHGFEGSQKLNSASKERLVGSVVAARDEPKTQKPNSTPKTAQAVVTETVAVPRGSKEEESGVCSDTAEGKKERRGGGEEEDHAIVSVVADSTKPPLLSSGKDLSSVPAAVPSTVPSDPLAHEANELDFNAFFNVDSIPGLNEMFSLEPEQAKCGSRFQQWFHLSSHGNSHSESRRSSLTDEFGYINDIIYGHNSPLGQISPPPPPNLLPPPPARASLFGSQSAFSAEKYSDETQNLLEMLQRANADVPFNGQRDATAAAAAAENASMNYYYLSNQGNGRTDAKDVEAGLKAILSGAVLGNSLLSGLSPSMAASLAAPPPPPPLPPPSGAKVLRAEDLEAHLVAAGGQAPADPGGGQGHHRNTRDIYGTVPGNSHRPVSPWSNSGTLSFCSLPVLPVGTKVTLLSDLEAGLKGLNVVNGNRGIINSASQPLLGGASDRHSNSLPPSAAGRPVSSHDNDEATVGQRLSSSAGNAFAGQQNDLAAYKKLLGLIVEPHGSQTASNNSLPIVTSPTSVSMSSLEANQPNNSLANNQRDFIQRYLLQQQQLKMLHHHHHQQPPPPPPPPPEGRTFAPSPSGLPPHLQPPDLPQAYLSPGMLSEPMPQGLLMGRTAAVSAEFALTTGGGLQGSCGYGRSSLGSCLNQPATDDLAHAPRLSTDFYGPFLPSQVQGQAHMAATRGRCVGSQMHGGLLPPQYQEVTTASVSQPSSSQSKHLMLLQESAKHALHQVSLQQQQQQQQQQLAKMTHLALLDQFPNSTKPKPGPLSPQPVPPPYLTLQPPPVSSHPSPAGLSMLGPQSLLQQPPQSPRRAPSPIMFGNQPPMNLTAPMPLHLSPMTPMLSPTLSPNTLQVAQSGSNLSSPVMRVPSPQELSGLAQSILQNALIKKQLEEQKERFIKRQQERNKSPMPQVPSGAAAAAAMTTASKAASTVAPSVLTAASVLEAGRASQSFLPTSVLRKMASSKVDEKTRLTDSSSSSGEKSVPLLKVVKPDEDAEDEDKENKSLSNLAAVNNTSSSNSLERSGLQFCTDDRASEMAVRSSVTTENAISFAVPASLPQTSDISSSGAQRLSQQAVASVPSLMSAGCSSVAETGLQSQASTRRLVGQGLMNVGLSAVIQSPPNRSLPLSPSSGSAIHPNFTAAAAGGGAAAVGFISSGRQIKGKKMPEQLSLGSAALAGKSRASDYHHQLQQQQQQFFAGGSTSGANNSSRAVALNLHALEMAKLLEQQRKGLLSSPMPPVPPPAMAPQFISAVPENGAYGVAPLPRMLVHPTFGVNAPAAAAAASNALLLQRLAYPNLQRGGLSSVNHLNLNQLALMQAVQLQAQQQQQQQQHLWNRNAARAVNNRGPYPAFATSSMPPRAAAATSGASSLNKPPEAGGGGGGGGGVGGANGLKTSTVSSANSGLMKTDGEMFISGTNLHQHLSDTVNRSEARSLAPGTEAVIHATTSAEQENGGNLRQASCRSDLASDVGNLAKWFGSDVFSHHLPPLVTSAGQKVLTVDEIEGWQRAAGES